MSEQKKILFVDQDNTVGKVLQLKMKNLGYNAEYAENLSEAFVVLKSFTPEIIISEMDFDNGTGIDFLKYLRLNPDTSKIPLYFISKARNVENKIIALEMGAENIYSKPVTIKFIENLVYDYFHKVSTESDNNGIESSSELSGKLINVSLYDLFEIVSKNGKSGVLNISATEDEKAFIYFINGSVVRAESFNNPDPDNGLSLIYDISGWNDGVFTILYDDSFKPVKNIFIQQKNLMANLSEYLHENLLRSRELPEPDKTIYLNLKRFFENLPKFPDSISGILDTFDENGVLLDEILRKESGFSRKKSEYVKKLIDMGVLVFQPVNENYEFPPNPHWFEKNSDKPEDNLVSENEAVPDVVEDIFADETDGEFEELEEIEEEIESQADNENIHKTSEDTFSGVFGNDIKEDISSLKGISEQKNVFSGPEVSDQLSENDITGEPVSEENDALSFDEHSIDVPENVLNNENDDLIISELSEKKERSDIDEIFDSRESSAAKSLEAFDIFQDGDKEDEDLLFSDKSSDIDFVDNKKSDSFPEAGLDETESLSRFTYEETVNEDVVDKAIGEGRKYVYSIMIPAIIVSLFCLIVSLFYILNRFFFKTNDTVNSIKIERILTSEEKANREIALIYGTKPELLKNEDQIDVKNMTIKQIAALAKDSFEKKDYEKAASYYRIAVMNATISTPEEKAYEGQLWKNMAISLYYMNAYDNALSAVEKSLLISRDPVKIDLKVAILNDSGRTEDAVETLENAIKDAEFDKDSVKKWETELKNMKK